MLRLDNSNALAGQFKCSSWAIQMLGLGNSIFFNCNINAHQFIINYIKKDKNNKNYNICWAIQMLRPGNSNNIIFIIFYLIF